MNVSNAAKIVMRVGAVAGVVYGGYKLVRFTQEAMRKSEIRYKASINRLVLQIEVLSRRLNVTLNETDLGTILLAKAAVTITDHSPERLVTLGDIEDELKRLQDWIINEEVPVEETVKDAE